MLGTPTLKKTMPTSLVCSDALFSCPIRIAYLGIRPLYGRYARGGPKIWAHTIPCTASLFVIRIAPCARFEAVVPIPCWEDERGRGDMIGTGCAFVVGCADGTVGDARTVVWVLPTGADDTPRPVEGIGILSCGRGSLDFRCNILHSSATTTTKTYTTLASSKSSRAIMLNSVCTSITRSPLFPLVGWNVRAK